MVSTAIRTMEKYNPATINNMKETEENDTHTFTTEDKIVEVLRTVYDPEIPVNVYDLGLIYELNINKNHDVSIVMTFTAPNCPMADEVMAEVKHNVELTPGINSCEIQLVFEPAWDQSLLSDEAKLALGMDIDLDEE